MQRKATRQSRGADAAEKRYHSWIKERGICSNCGNDGGVYLHHCEGSAFKLNKLMLGHIFVIGLCHQCDDLITHGSRKTFRKQFGAQSELWAKQLEDYPLKHEIREDEKQAIIGYGK